MDGRIYEGRSHFMALILLPRTATSKLDGTAPRRRRFSRWLVVAAAVLMTAGSVANAGIASADSADQRSSSSQPDFGSNVKIFDPSMPMSEIQATVDAIATAQVDNEMGTERYTLLFKPGTYGTPDQPLIFKVGYYTEVAGLGVSPTDVTINGHVDVYNRCLTSTNCIALVNFWRSMSNLSINVAGETGCRASGEFWAVSQAAPLRRGEKKHKNPHNHLPPPRPPHPPRGLP